MTTFSQEFREVRKLIEQGWTQGAYARSASGYSVDSNSTPDAVCWCLSGAIIRVATAQAIPVYKIRDRLREVLFLRVGNGSIVVWNDAPLRTKEEVLALLDFAIDPNSHVSA